jgi:type I restriction enzyme, S subunit
MASEWPRVEVSQLLAQRVLVIGDGYRAKNEELGAVGLPFCRAGNIQSGFDFTDCDRYPIANLGRVGEKISRPGDVVFTSKGTVGRFAFVTTWTQPFVYSPQLCYWRSLDPDVLDPQFLYYWMRGPEFEVQYRAVAGQTDMADYVSLGDQNRMWARVPEIRAQRHIARTLGALDNKIELNRRMSQTLEATTRVLFKSWFVDFEPVRANADGRDPGLPQHVAGLFPERLVNSELGEIPEGWGTADVYEIADVVYGAPFSSTRFNTQRVGRPLIRIRDLDYQKPTVWTTEELARGYVVRAGDVVVGMDGEFRARLWHGPDAWLNQRVCVFKPKLGWSAAFVRGAIAAPLAEVEASETATTVIHLGKADIDRFRVVVPPAGVVAAFGAIADPQYQRIVGARREAAVLASIRDALLPRLLSGDPSVTTRGAH